MAFSALFHAYKNKPKLLFDFMCPVGSFQMTSYRRTWINSMIVDTNISFSKCLTRKENDRSISLTASLSTLSSGPWSMGSSNNEDLSSTDILSTHAIFWAAERLTGLVMLFLFPLDFVYPSPSLEFAISLMAVMHGHWGLEATLTDYVQPKLFGHFISGAAQWAVYALSAVTLAGLLHLTFTGAGIAETIKTFWKIR